MGERGSGHPPPSPPPFQSLDPSFPEAKAHFLLWVPCGIHNYCNSITFVFISLGMASIMSPPSKDYYSLPTYHSFPFLQGTSW